MENQEQHPFLYIFDNYVKALSIVQYEGGRLAIFKMIYPAFSALFMCNISF